MTTGTLLNRKTDFEASKASFELQKT